MKRWLGRLRGTLGMGFVWALGGFGIGGAIELLDNVLPGRFPFIARVDMWPQTLMIPGFIGGVIFSIVLMLAAVRFRFDELSMGRFVACGAVTGLALGGIAMSIGAPVGFVGITMLTSMFAASLSLGLARFAVRKPQLAAGADLRELADAEDEPRQELGRGD